jgi:hypothetical protein
MQSAVWDSWQVEDGFAFSTLQVTLTLHPADHICSDRRVEKPKASSTMHRHGPTPA